MSRGKITVLAVVAALLLSVLSGALWVWKRPLELFAWMSRRSLAGAGLTKDVVDSPVGEQTLWQGGSGPTLLLLHGAGDQAGTWSQVVPALVRRYRLIVPDLAGHGESAPGEGPLTIGIELTGVEAVVQNRASGTRVILVGNSLGAWLAMLYAVRHPDRVARVVGVNGGALRGDRPDLTLTPTNRAEARKLFDALTDPGSPRVPDFVLDDVVRQARVGPLGRLASTSEDMRNYLLEGRLNELTVPVDLLWGGADRLLPLEYASKMEAGLPAARLTVIPRCGHVPQQECPASFIAALEKILEQPPPGPESGLSRESGNPKQK
jgi:pimeloyl-ACP methyl ester carboxylesterase